VLKWKSFVSDSFKAITGTANALSATSAFCAANPASIEKKVLPMLPVLPLQ
jgi:hypothetical protein